MLNETNSLLGDRFKFTGRELNSGNDYYFRTRTYNANQGRFGSSDRLGFSAGDANLMRYINNNPLFATDPTGEQAVVSFAVLTIIPLTFLISCDNGVLSGSPTPGPPTPGQPTPGPPTPGPPTSGADRFLRRFANEPGTPGGPGGGGAFRDIIVCSIIRGLPSFFARALEDRPLP